MIKREMYLKKIRDSYDSELIKIIVGVRRSGKSVLMMQIIDELKEKGINEDHIIYILILRTMIIQIILNLKNLINI